MERAGVAWNEAADGFEYPSIRWKGVKSAGRIRAGLVLAAPVIARAPN